MDLCELRGHCANYLPLPVADDALTLIDAVRSELAALRAKDELWKKREKQLLAKLAEREKEVAGHEESIAALHAQHAKDVKTILAAEAEVERLKEALEKVEEIGFPGNYGGDIRGIARAALAKLEEKP